MTMKALSLACLALCLLLSVAVSLSAAPPDPFLQPAFSAPGDQPNTVTPAYASDRVIVKLTPDAAMGVMGRGGKRVPERLAKTMQQLGVRRVEPLLPHMWQTGSAGPERVVDRAERIMAKFPIRSLRAGRGWHDIPDIENILVLQLSPAHDALEVAERLGRLPEVVYAEPEYYAELAWVPNDPYFNSSGSWGQPYDDQWALRIIGAEAAWDVGNGSGVVVAVIDSGVDYLHEDLAGQMWTNPDEVPGNGVDDDHNGYIDDVMGWDFKGPLESPPGDAYRGYPDNDPMDGYGHGTVVAGAVAAATDNGTGVAGLAYGARIMALKVMGDDLETGSFNGNFVPAAVAYAAENGADVINCSFIGGGDTWGDLFEYALSLGSIVVGAAGNNASNQVLGLPAGLPSTITVGASAPSDVSSGFSNWGVRIDLVAPGEGVLVPSYWDNHLGGWPWVGGSYQPLAGTSLSAPIVSAAVALILAQYPGFDLEQVRGILRASADDIGSAGWDRRTAYGRLNVASALLINAPCRAGITSPSPAFSMEGGYFDAPLPVRDLVEVRGTANGPGFVSYDLTYGRSYDPTSWTVFASSTTPVTDGLLAVWDASGLPHGSYQLCLTVRDATGRQWQDHLLLLNCSDESPGFPLHEYWGQPLVVDVDGDGWQEIFDGLGHAIDDDGDDWAHGLLVGEQGAWGDIDGDARLEAVWSDGVGLHARRLDGTEPPGWPLPYPYALYSTLADVNGDGTLEVVAQEVLAPSYRVHVVTGRGTELPGWPKSLPGYLHGRPAIADLDGDGTPEVVLPVGVSQSVYVWTSRGVLLAGWPVSWSGDPYYASLAIGDINADGTKEVILRTHEGLFVWDHHGTSLPGWPKTLGGDCWFPRYPAALGDLDRDGMLEVVTGESYNGYGRVHVFRYDGIELAGWPQNTEAFPEAFSIADVDGDDGLDVLCGSWRNSADCDDANDNFVYAWRRDGSPVTGFPKELADDARGIAIAVLGDEDSLSVLCGSANAGLHAWSVGSAYKPPLVEWVAQGFDGTRNRVYRLHTRAPEVLLEVHPNERAPGVGTTQYIGKSPWSQPTSSPAGSYWWKKYEFAAHGPLWIQVCAQNWDKTQKGYGDHDDTKLQVNGVAPTDYDGIQTGTRSWQWLGQNEAGKRVALRFLVPVTPGKQTLWIGADESPALWWLKVIDLEPGVIEAF